MSFSVFLSCESVFLRVVFFGRVDSGAAAAIVSFHLPLVSLCGGRGLGFIVDGGVLISLLVSFISGFNSLGSSYYRGGWGVTAL